MAATLTKLKARYSVRCDGPGCTPTSKAIPKGKDAYRQDVDGEEPRWLCETCAQPFLAADGTPVSEPVDPALSAPTATEPAATAARPVSERPPAATRPVRERQERPAPAVNGVSRPDRPDRPARSERAQRPAPAVAVLDAAVGEPAEAPVRLMVPAEPRRSAPAPVVALAPAEPALAVPAVELPAGDPAAIVVDAPVASIEPDVTAVPARPEPEPELEPELEREVVPVLTTGPVEPDTPPANAAPPEPSVVAADDPEPTPAPAPAPEPAAPAEEPPVDTVIEPAPATVDAPPPPPVRLAAAPHAAPIEHAPAPVPASVPALMEPDPVIVATPAPNASFPATPAPTPFYTAAPEPALDNEPAVDETEPEPPTWPRWVAAIATFCVAIASATISFVAQSTVAAREQAVPGRLSFLVPVIIDGGVMAASAVLWAWAATGRRSRRPWLAYATAAVLLAVSTIVNLNDAGPSLLAKLIAGLPPIVLFVAVELAAGLRATANSKPHSARRA